LSNKLKVIALLLLVSLLSGCNGTTGSGNLEVGMQSNSPPTNTTRIPTTNTSSVPISEAENPAPTMGNAVRVARWSRNPDTMSMLAVRVGKLAIANNCLVMNNEDARPTLLIFPYRSGIWDDAKRTFTFEGKVIRIGEPIEVSGGNIGKNFDYLKANGKYYVPDCGITELFVVN
jgi:hypothetical protein